MYFLWKRWARAGYLPPWFYALLALAFAALALIALAREQWLALTLAIVMITVSLVAMRFMPRLADAAEASRRRFYPDDRK